MMNAAPSSSASDPNPTRAGPDWPPAVIAGAWRTGVLGMRSLARRGVSASCFDCNPSYEGFRSRYGRGFVCPDPDSDPEGWVAFVIELAERMGAKPVLIASADQFVSAIAAHAGKLAARYVLSPGAELQGALSNKVTQYELAAAHGMPRPHMRCVTSFEEISAFASSARFPCLLKPTHFREWRRLPPEHPFYDTKVTLAETPDDLIANWRLVSEITPTVIAQEIVLGPDTSKRVYMSCYSRQRRRIGNALVRPLRCDPVGFGPATVSEPVADMEADQACDRFLSSVGYSGICEIEVKRDARDGHVKLIEVNPRLSGNGDAAPYAGVDLCWLHYLDMIGKDVTPVSPNGRDFRHVVLRADVAAIIRYRRERLASWTDVVRSYRPPLAFFDLDAGDWRYSVQTIYRMVRSAVRELVHLIRPRARAFPVPHGRVARLLAPEVSDESGRRSPASWRLSR